MSDPFRLVADFNSEIIGLEAPHPPTRLSLHRKGRRIEHLVEELKEFHAAPTIEDEIDALIDLIYVGMGALHEMGVDGLQHFYEVHNCNMQRVRGENPNRPDAGGWDGFDAVKPEGWVGPDHAAVIEATGGVLPPSPRAFDDVYRGPCPIPPPSEVTYVKPKVILVGHGRHGKDTAAEMLRDKYGFRFCSSSLFCAERVMLPAFKAYGLSYGDAETCFDDRHGSSPVGDHREFWFKNIQAYCTPDKARLAKELFEAGNDIYVGIRDRREFWAARLAIPGLLTVWVDASDRLPPEGAGSMNIEPWMCDVVLDNNGDLEQLLLGVDRLVEAML